MTKLKTIFSVFSLVFLSAGLFAAGGKESTSSLQVIQDLGEIHIGTEGTYPPFSFHNSNGKLTGFDVELARAVAQGLGVKAVFHETQWDAIFAGLNSQRFDFIANQVGIKPDRLEKYAFSHPYITSPAVLVVSSNNHDIQSFSDLQGKKAAQSLTSNFGEIARDNGAEVIQVDGLNQSLELLISRRVDATVNDRIAVLTFLKEKPNSGLKIVATGQNSYPSGLAFRQGQEDLLNAVNAVLQELFDSGKYLEISEQWFGEDVR